MTYMYRVAQKYVKFPVQFVVLKMNRFLCHPVQLHAKKDNKTIQYAMLNN